MMPAEQQDQNLLFAVVMLRNGFVSQNQFVNILNQWAENKSVPVGQLAVANGWLEEADTSAIRRLVGRQIHKHGSVEQSISHHTSSLDLSLETFVDESVRDMLQASTIRPTLTEANNAAIDISNPPADSRTSATMSMTTPTGDVPSITSPSAGTNASANSETAGFVVSNSELDITAPSGSNDSSGGSRSSDSRSSGSRSSSGSRRSRSGKGYSSRSSRPRTSALPDSRFEIVRPHARGGLGKVSIARDTELNREVALKEIRSVYAKDRLSRDRFVLEANITGKLEHPGVVPVYGFGKNEDGSPYFAMRFIRGKTLKEAVVEYHRAEGETNESEKRMQFRNLLTRFVDACNAIAYAHNRGVIHRDIKPSNIMLGKFGETLMVDWGLAKRTGRDEVDPDEDSLVSISGSAVSGTLDGSTIGTPTYMSPEQAEGRLNEMGPASDIYSLGSTLYFILTGKTAFTGSNAAEVVKQVRENEFLPPRERNALIPAPLNSICCKAMATSPKHRYESAGSLALEIENWLGDEPVEAHQESWFAQCGRWLRHHRTLATSAAVLLTTLTAASIVGAVFINAEKNKTVAEQRKTEQALVELQAARNETELALTAETEARRQTRDVLNTVTDDLVGELMARQVELGDADRLFFDRVLNQFETFTSTSSNSPEAQNLKADGFFRVGNLQRRLDELDAASESYAHAETIWERISASHSQPEYRFDLAAVRANQAILLARRGQHQLAIDKESEAAEILQSLIAEHPDDARYQLDFARLLGNRGNAYQRLSKPKQAETDYQQALDLFDDLKSGETSDVAAGNAPELEKAHAVAISNLAGLYSSQKNRISEAVNLYRRVVGVRENLVSLENSGADERRKLALSQQNLGTVLLQQNKNDDAIAQLNAAIQTQIELTQSYPALTTFRRDLSRSRAKLASALFSLGEEGAEAELIAAKQISADLAEKFPQRVEFKSDLAEILDQYGSIYRETDTKKAQEMYQRGLDLRIEIEALDPDNNTHSDNALGAEINFANFLRLSDELDLAIESYSAVLSKLEAKENPAPMLIRAAVFGLGDSCVKTADYEKALECWERLVHNEKDPAWKVFELQRAICNVRVEKIDEGIEAAEAVLSAEEPDGLVCYDVACCFAVAAGLETDKTKSESFAARAVELLGRAGDNEFFDDAMKTHAASDVDLDTLREREDFAALCEKFQIE